ncbi:hypothetical protein L2750_22400 [Shewanella submarina]|nr:hypothetical protein [Shewanella submarina]MCL1039858.1 hypothetical protein [Shewanella submarina]
MDKQNTEEQRRAETEAKQQPKYFGLPVENFMTPPCWAELISDIPLIASNDPVYQ